MTELALDIRKVSHRFGHDVLAVDDVSFQVEAGEVFGLVGPDGAGKSTLIRMLATVLMPSHGDAEVFGHSVCKDAGGVKPRIGYMSQQFSLYPDLTVRENLAFFANLRGVPRGEVASRSKRLLEFAGLTEFAKRQAQYLSGGMKQKLALAVTLIHEPDLLFLDEPTTGVDPVSRREFWRIIAGLHQQGITVFVATPYMDEAERCSHVAFMEGGRILFRDTPAGLKASVPGTLYELVVSDQRHAVRQLAEEPWTLASTVYGDVVRTVVGNGGPGAEGVRDALSLAGIGVESIAPARVDMEATFAFLAEETRKANIETAAAREREEAVT
ncbi:MAG: ABC transporter ATP-binding protein [Actinomycetota bacterium]|nr:ABC transporter ATP-binding protein [Actinomycetota bacterium]